MEMRISKEISKEEYREMKDAIDAQIVALSVEGNTDEGDFNLEAAISRAVDLISHVVDEWKKLESPFKQRLQKAVLPQGVTYQKTNGTFGTAILSPIFKLSGTFLLGSSDLVAGAGIEPAIFRL